MLKEIHTARSSEERKGGYSREKRGKEGIPEGREEGGHSNGGKGSSLGHGGPNS